jgi:hypothetical protein|tara:strand:+ start:5297 stop:5656 length:360 start_codon:yes stop_codon:yes gene_type:complete
MAEQGGIDGRDMCSSVKDMNGVLLANIKGIGGRDRTACTTCESVSLAGNRIASTACALACDTFFTDGTPSNLQLGDKIFSNAECTELAARNYYSNRCGARSGNVYLIDSNGAITNIASC